MSSDDIVSVKFDNESVAESDRIDKADDQSRAKEHHASRDHIAKSQVGYLIRPTLSGNQNACFTEGVDILALVQLGYGFSYDKDGSLSIHGSLNDHQVRQINDRTAQLRSGGQSSQMVDRQAVMDTDGDQRSAEGLQTNQPPQDTRAAPLTVRFRSSTPDLTEQHINRVEGHNEHTEVDVPKFVPPDERLSDVQASNDVRTSAELDKYKQRLTAQLHREGKL